ncbi:MAG: hypothetical protein CM1200mP2_41610 [Planctomycetaceae bacterium]|nr:MAG: hypothetical protein CM1200mP2_41610 [Planctomycetaceae bacterium]
MRLPGHRSPPANGWLRAGWPKGIPADTESGREREGPTWTVTRGGCRPSPGIVLPGWGSNIRPEILAGAPAAGGGAIRKLISRALKECRKVVAVSPRNW